MKRMLIALMLLGLSAAPGFAANVTKIYGTNDTLVSDATNVTSNSGVIGSEVSWTSAGYTRADCELNAPSTSAAPAAGTGVSVWLIVKPDGTNYEDGSGSVFPARAPDMFFPLRNATGGQRVDIKDVPIPVGPVKAIAKNEGT